MGWRELAKGVARALGLGPRSEHVRALSETDRWGLLLRALRVEPQVLIPALSLELGRGLNMDERRIKPPKEAAFFDGLLVGKKTQALDLMCASLDQAAARARVMSKLPSLREWAGGALFGSLSLASNSEGVEWARTSGHFEPGVLREAILAEAIEMGSSEIALRELADAGRDRIDPGDMTRYMDGFARRKAAGLSKGLDAAGLDALAASFGGWEELAGAAAGLGAKDIMELASLLLDALAEEELVETKILARAKAVASKSTRELMALALAAQAAKSDRPRALRALVGAMAEARGGAIGVSRAARENIAGATIRVSGVDVRLAGNGGANLHEIAKLSGSVRSSRALAEMDPGGGVVAPARMAQLVGAVESGYSRQARREGSGRESTRAWRKAAKAWRQGLLGDVDLKGMQSLVDRSALTGVSGSALTGVSGSAPALHASKGPISKAASTLSVRQKFSEPR